MCSSREKRPASPRLLSAALLGLLVPAGAAAQDEAPPEPLTISPALAVHVSAAGLEALGDSIREVLPAGIRAVNLAGEIDCDEDEPGTLTYSSDDIQVRISADDVTISPSAGRLDVSMEMTLYSDPAQITATGNCLLELDTTCTLELEPTRLQADLGVLLSLGEGGTIAAEVDGLTFTHGNFGNPVEPGCVLGDALETLQGYEIDLIGDLLDQVLEGQLAELESQLTEALTGLTAIAAIEQSMEVMGSTIDFSLSAQTLDITGSGLRLIFGAAFGTPAYGSCVPRGDRYLPSAHDMPALTGMIPDTQTPYHLAIVASEDLVNQALFAAWQGGVLCLDLAALAPDIDFTTALLELIDSELVQSIWPDPVPIDILTAAAAPPRAVFADGPRLDAALALNVFGPELDRTTRFWGNGLVADAGLDLFLQDGELVVDVDFDLETHLGITVAYNEWLPSSLPEGFAGMVPTLIPDSLLPEEFTFRFPVPSLYGLTLSALDMRVVGAEQDFLGVYGWLDPTQVSAMELGDIDLGGLGCGDTEGGGEIGVPGCEDGAGCGGEEGSGCGGGEEGGCGGCSGEEGGCDSSSCSASRRAQSRWTMMGLVPLLLVLRRRR